MGENLLMKIKVKRSELQSNDDIWNASERLSIYATAIYTEVLEIVE